MNATLASALLLALSSAIIPLPKSEMRLVVEICAAHYGVDSEYAMCIAQRESEWNPRAVGDYGKARGLWQWHLGSWRHVRRAMGLPETDLRYDPIESTLTACWALANGYEHWWSTSASCRTQVRRQGRQGAGG